jgi:hypothetical protein
LHAVAEELPAAQVLTAADPPANARPTPHHFGDESFHIAGPGDEVTMAAMIGKNDVALAIKAVGQHHCGQFLADARMSSAGDLALGE